MRAFVEGAFAHAGLDWQEHVEIDPRYYRPAEVDFLEGDATRAREVLGWTPATSFSELLRMMTEHDVELARREQVLAEAAAPAGMGA